MKSHDKVQQYLTELRAKTQSQFMRPNKDILKQIDSNVNLQDSNMNKSILGFTTRTSDKKDASKQVIINIDGEFAE
jgi:hypothetical protein